MQGYRTPYFYVDREGERRDGVEGTRRRSFGLFAVACHSAVVQSKIQVGPRQQQLILTLPHAQKPHRK